MAHDPDVIRNTKVLTKKHNTEIVTGTISGFVAQKGERELQAQHRVEETGDMEAAGLHNRALMFFELQVE